jgi:hypothetical protein
MPPKSMTGQPGAQGTRPVERKPPAANNAAAHVSPQVARNYRFTEAFPEGRGHAGPNPPAPIVIPGKSKG